MKKFALLVLQSIDGLYGAWSQWTPCSLACGEGLQKRLRVCNVPAPAHGGKDCIGEGRQEMKCNVAACPRKLFVLLARQSL